MLLSKYLDPKNEVVFERLLGADKNNDILIHFINNVVELSGEQAIQTVHVLKPVSERVSKKQPLLNVCCIDKAGQRSLIQIQIAHSESGETTRYDTSAAYMEHLPFDEGILYSKHVIFMVLSDFIIFPEKQAYDSLHGLVNKETHSHDLNHFSYLFLELPKLTKTLDGLSSLRDKWAYFFKHGQDMNEEEQSHLAGEDPIFLRAYQALNRSNGSEVELNTHG